MPARSSVAPVGIVQTFSGGIGSRGVRSGIDGHLIVAYSQLAFAVHVVALAGRQQRPYLEFRPNILAKRSLLVSPRRLVVVPLTALRVAQAKVGQFQPRFRII